VPKYKTSATVSGQKIALQHYLGLSGHPRTRVWCYSPPALGLLPASSQLVIKPFLASTHQSDPLVFKFVALGVSVQFSHLTDDELWRAITKNTNAMSALFDQEHEAGIKGVPDFQTSGMFSISRAVDNLEREYRSYADQLRHRSSIALHSETPSTADQIKQL
jgi:hypothetical protein